MAVEHVFGGTVVWHSEIDKAASKLLAYRYPDIPNLGDISAIDWSDVPAIDILCGGFPCQDVSLAASYRRQGMRPDNRSGLWSHMATAIQETNPKVVVIENVRGLLSAKAHRGVGFQYANLDPLRAAGAVLGDLADLGFDAAWTTLAASEVGAPHGRPRVFIIATREGAETPVQPCSDQIVDGGLTLLPTPSASDVTGGSCDPSIRVQQGHHLQLIDVARLYGTPAWEAYTPAIQQWERITRPAPKATHISRAGNPNLSAAFAEWMMGWPEGWLDVPGEQEALFGDSQPALNRADKLRICGNGVVPQQAIAAITQLVEVHQ